MSEEAGVMPVTLLSYALEGIETVPTDVVVDGDQVRVAEPEIGRRLTLVRGSGPVGAGSGGCPLRNLAPARLRKGTRQRDSRERVEESIQRSFPSRSSVSK
jgi:hypothetical protein